ncbi:hypothetical protein LYNGBM3L_43760 [Moorena producens 3L]|uniref:Uncharacterized protein n=1 Tax=Moorena producens 3L TaxID=489825 RepID=F4XWB4_9CYAN|nr:hypothetical protein LYNGBM3L_43760 [Moorena producens 3L]
MQADGCSFVFGTDRMREGHLRRTLKRLIAVIVKIYYYLTYLPRPMDGESIDDESTDEEYLKKRGKV